MPRPRPTGLWTVSGPTGVGKTTLCKALLDHYHPHAKPLKRVTTREKRPSDIDGEYDYVTEEKFWRMHEEKYFLDILQLPGYWHGMPVLSANEALSDGALSITDLAPEMIEPLVMFAGMKWKRPMIRSIYLTLEDEVEMRRRLVERNQSNIDVRIEACHGYIKKIKKSHVYYYIIDGSLSREDVAAKAIKYLGI